MAKEQAGGWEEFQRDVAAGRLARVTILTGEETRLKEAAAAALTARALQGEPDDFNVSQFDGADADQEAFFAAAFAPPLFAGRRVAVVRRAEQAPWMEVLPRYLPDLPDSTTLILVTGTPPEGGSSQTGRKKSPLDQVLEAAGEAGRRYDFPELRRRDVLPHLMAEAKRLGLTLSPEASEALRAKTGTDLGQLVSELEKLAVYLGPEAHRVEVADVAAVVGQTALDNSFAFVDAVLTGDTAGALSVLHDLFAAGETPQAILAQLAAQFRRVVLVKALGAEGWPGVKLLRPLELGSAWAAEKVRDQGRRLSLDRVEWALALILRADYRLKRRRGLVPEVELEVLAGELCSAKQALSP